VAPLTATVLGSVEAGHSGLASGVNNAVARVAGLIAIAAIGAVVASSFQTRLTSQVRGRGLTPAAQHAVAVARTRPLVTNVSGVRGPERAVVHAAAVNASVYAFRIGMLVGGALVIIGGLTSLLGIENPRRRVLAAECSGGALVGAAKDAAGALTPSRVARAAGTPSRNPHRTGSGGYFDEPSGDGSPLGAL
jgi:hypothetical protein